MRELINRKKKKKDLDELLRKKCSKGQLLMNGRTKGKKKNRQRKTGEMNFELLIRDSTGADALGIEPGASAYRAGILPLKYLSLGD